MQLDQLDDVIVIANSETAPELSGTTYLIINPAGALHVTMFSNELTIEKYSTTQLPTNQVYSDLRGTVWDFEERKAEPENCTADLIAYQLSDACTLPDHVIPGRVD